MIAAPYTTVLLDLDHTLLDSDRSERLAFSDALAAAAVPFSDETFSTYQRINGDLWNAVERGELSPDDVRFARFEALVEELGIGADPVTMAESFVDGLGEHGDLYTGVRETLDRLVALAALGLVTNGISEVQRTRIERLGIEQYFQVIIVSAEVGIAKPSPAIFDLAFEGLHRPHKETALMVGDSLTSDMAGGIAFGIDTCWYNPNGASTDAAVTHEINELSALPELVAVGRLRPC